MEKLSGDPGLSQHTVFRRRTTANSFVHFRRLSAYAEGMGLQSRGTNRKWQSDIDKNQEDIFTPCGWLGSAGNMFCDGKSGPSKEHLYLMKVLLRRWLCEIS